MLYLVRRPVLLPLQNVRFKTDLKILDEIIRVDHAGELGADRIYAGQMAILGQTSKGPLIKHMWDQEKHHRSTFENLIKKHRVRPTMMTPIWNVTGFMLVEKDKKANKPSLDVITQCIGSFGKWQFCMSFAIFMCKFPVAWHQLSILMIGPDIKFNCTDGRFQPCDKNCPQHEFDKSVFSETISMKWDLVCNRGWLRDAAQSITMAGILIGNVIWGYISDRFGRFYPLLVEVMLQGVTGVLAAATPWFWCFNVMRFLSAFATGGSMITSFVLLMEIIGVKYRTIIGILYQIPFYLGHLSLPLWGYLCREWKCIQIVISVPSFFLICYYWILPESPRWLAVQGEYEKAATILKNAARFNSMPTENIANKVYNLVQIKDPSTVKHKNGNGLDLVRTRIIRKYTITICYNWIVCGFCFFGIAQYTSSLAGNIFLNVAVSAALQVPSTLLACWSTKALGRRWTLILADLLVGAGMLLIITVPERVKWINIINTMIAMFGLSLAFPTIYIYSGEIFPTTVRNVGVGIAAMLSRIGAIVAPHVVSLKRFHWWLPPLIFGIIPLIGAALCILLPETVDCKLPDTIEEAEATELLRKAEPKGRGEQPSTSS